MLWPQVVYNSLLSVEAWAGKGSRRFFCCIFQSLYSRSGNQKATNLMDVSEAEQQSSHFCTCLFLCEPFSTDQKVQILNPSAAWISPIYICESVSPLYILLQQGQCLMRHPMALLMLHAHCAENSWWANLQMHVEGAMELEGDGCWARDTWQHLMLSIGHTAN